MSPVAIVRPLIAPASGTFSDADPSVAVSRVSVSVNVAPAMLFVPFRFTVELPSAVSVPLVVIVEVPSAVIVPPNCRLSYQPSAQRSAVVPMS